MDMLLPKRLKKIKIVNLLLITSAVVGLIFISIGIYINHQRSLLTFDVAVIPEESTQNRIDLPKPVNISIKDLGIDLPIEEGNISGGVWEISDVGAIHLYTSARPGAGGNIVIYGHNKSHIFGNLIGGVKTGQVITLETEEGREHSYKISKIQTVNPDQIGVVLPTGYEVLTVYTCSGFLDSKRLVIRALPINNNSI